MMTTDEIKAILTSKGLQIVSSDRLSNDSGFQLKLKTGQIVDSYDTGKWHAQGKDPAKVKALLESADGACSSPPGAGSRKVFVVYGHDKQARSELEAMLGRWGLEVLCLDQLPSQGRTLIEKLEHYRNEARFAVVLATPDDEGNRVGRSAEKAFRARQNVVLELGMMLAVLGREKVAILLKDQKDMEKPSDIDGLIYLPFKDEVKEVAIGLAKEMATQGIDVDVKKL